MDIELIGKVWKFFFDAALVTAHVSALSICLGLVIGAILVSASLSRPRYICWPARAYVSIFRGTPALIQLFILYFGGPQIGIHLEPMAAGVIGLGMNIGAYMSESMRGAILAVDKGQIEAGRCLGLNNLQVQQKIILPQAARLMIRPLGVNSIALIKGSVIVSTISLVELTFTAHRFISSTYKPFELFALASVFYLIMISAVSFIVDRLDNYFALEE